MNDVSPDLRSWLATLDGAGQLRRIVARVDWNEEIGAITRANLSLGGRHCCSRTLPAMRTPDAPNSSRPGSGAAVRSS